MLSLRKTHNSHEVRGVALGKKPQRTKLGAEEEKDLSKHYRACLKQLPGGNYHGCY